MAAAKIPLSEVVPVGTWRRQSKAKLAAPTREAFEGKTVLLIGATGAILSNAARILADLLITTLILGVRNVKKGEALADELRRNHGQLDIKIWEVDFVSFESVKRFAATINEYGRIDAIVMGSGVFNEETRMTKDGWEETLQISHLSTALLVLLILPKILANTEGPPVVLSSVSSLVIRMGAPTVKLPSSPQDSYLAQVNCVEDSGARRRNQYGFAKIMHACWLRELCARLPPPPPGPGGSAAAGASGGRPDVHFHAVDPGVFESPISRLSIYSRFMLWWIGRPVEMSARAVVNSCLPVPGSHGKLLLDYDVVPWPEYMDRELGLELRQRVWSETKQVLTDTFPETEAFFTSLAAETAAKI